MDGENGKDIKRCPFCESGLMVLSDSLLGGKPYLECPTCGLRFRVEGFDENPTEIKSAELN